MATDNKFAIRLVLIVCAIVVLYILVVQFNKKTSTTGVTSETRYKEKFESSNPKQQAPATVTPTQPIDPVKASDSVKPSEPTNNEDYKAVDFQTSNQIPSSCFPRDKLTAEDLLPKDAANSKWAEANPAGQGDVRDKNYLNAGFLIGIDTVGQSLRNANYQLRSDPPNPRMNVGPWNQSTIENDTNRRYFEINDC